MRARIAFCCLLLVALVLPPAADAREKPTPRSVQKHVRAANKALGTVAGGKKDGRKAVRRWRREMRVAHNQARRLARKRTRRGVKALRTVGAGDDRCADVIAQAVDELDGALQVDAAKLLEACIELRQKVIATLERLVEKLPEEYKPLVASAIAALSSGSEDDIAALTEALAASLPAEVEDLLEQVLAQATQAVQDAVEQLGEIAPAAGDLGTELTELQAQLQQLLDQLLSPPGATTPPPPGDDDDAPALPPDLLELLLGILG